MNNPMKVNDIVIFLKKYGTFNPVNVIPIISFSHLIIFCLFYTSFNENNFVYLMLLIMIFSYIISFNFVKLIHLKKEENINKFLTKLKHHTALTNNYNCLNYLLLDKKCKFFDDNLKKVFKNNNLDKTKIYKTKRYLFE